MNKMKRLILKITVLSWVTLLLSFVNIKAGQLEKLWAFPVGAPVQSSPAIGNDGTIYFGADNGIFYALDPSGKKKWEFVTSGQIVSTPAIAADGTIYVASLDQIIYALNPDGTEKWRLMPGRGLVSSPAIDPDGNIYIGSVFNRFFAISPDGFRKWEFPTAGSIVSSPAVSPARTIYFGCMDTNFYAVSTNGTMLWKFTADDKINSSPAIDKEDSIYFGSLSGTIYALDKDGNLRWTFKTGGAVRASPVIGVDGTLYIGSDDTKFYAISVDGTKKWEFQTEGQIRSTPAIAEDDTIYFGSNDGLLYALNKDGILQGTFVTEGKISSSPVISDNGVLYFGSWDNNFYALKTSSKLADSSWAVFRQNKRRTGSPIPDKPIQPPQKTKPLIIKEIAEPIKPREQPQPEEQIKTNLVTTPPTVSKTEPRKLTSATQKAPSIKIITPKNGTKVNEPYLTIEGTSRDDTGLATVEYKINGKKTQLASGLGKWSAKVQLEQGENIFEARCINTAGVPSDWAKITIYYVPIYTVYVQINGKGSVKPEISGKPMEHGKKIVLTAEPSRGYSFSGWSGSLISASQEIGFVMSSNMLLIANFIPTVQEQKTIAKAPALEEKPTKIAEKKSDTATIQLIIKGEGDVYPRIEGAPLKKGKEYKLTARPKPGYIFGGWFGSITSLSPELQLIVDTNLTIEAHFIPNPFLSMEGAYSCLIMPVERTNLDLIGSLTIQVDNSGVWRGKMIFNGDSYNTEGRFDLKLRSYATIKRGNKLPINIFLLFTNNQLNGWINTQTNDIYFESAKHLCDPKTQNCPYSSKYNFILASPEPVNTNLNGDNYAVGEIDKTGQLIISGKLCDGYSFSGSFPVCADLSIPIYITLYRGEGALIGWLILTNKTTTDISGQLLWIIPNKNSSTPTVNTLQVLGSIYNPRTPWNRVINATNLVVVLRDGGINSPVANIVRLEPQNKFFVEFTDVDLKISLDNDTGLFRGSFVHPVFRKTTKFEGVFLQKPNWGSGFFIYKDSSGIILIAPHRKDESSK